MKKGLIAVISLLTGVTLGASTAGKLSKEATEKNKIMSDKHLALFLMMNQWVKTKQEGKSIAKYLDENGYKKIAIYGMSYVGETLLEELKDSTVEVAFGIDENARNLFCDIDIVQPDEKFGDVDAIIVTPIFFMNEIEEKLSLKVKCPIISLEDILLEL